MKRLTIFGILSCMPLLWAYNASAQNYRVLVATYEKAVESDYFNGQGLENVVSEVDKNNLHRYYIRGRFAVESEARQMLELAISKGFEHARIIDLEELRRACEGPCSTPAIIPQSYSMDSPLQYEGTVGIIFFDFDKDVLRPASKEELDALKQIMDEHPDYHVKLRAHTDAKGTDTYNVDLSSRRAKSARAYLIRKGIPAGRINTEVRGESTPIAKNETPDGQDLPQGRQYNRRVEFILTDDQGRVLSEMVEDVQIPDYLKVY